MRAFMLDNGLKPNAYDLHAFSEDLPNDVKILWMAAMKKG
jgi:hypothetical protein